METQTDYQKAMELAEANRHKEALECIQRHLDAEPDNAEALNDAGALLFCLGRSDEAIEHFLKARDICSDSAEILWNLAEAYLDVGNTGKASGLFDQMQQLGILNVDILNRTAEIFLNQDNPVDALDMLNRSLQICPDQKIIKPMIEIISGKIEERDFT